MDSLTIWRIQDADGRGPWKPGFSNRWIDRDFTQERADRCPAIFDEFGRATVLAAYARRAKWHKGCGFTRLADSQWWFTMTELMRLDGYGYLLARSESAEVLLTGRTQVVFASPVALRYWEIVGPATELRRAAVA